MSSRGFQEKCKVKAKGLELTFLIPSAGSGVEIRTLTSEGQLGGQLEFNQSLTRV